MCAFNLQAISTVPQRGGEMKTRVSTQGRSGPTAQPMKQLRDLMAGLVLTLLGLAGRPADPSLITLACGWLPPWVAHLGSIETGLSEKEHSRKGPDAKGSGEGQ